MARLGSIIKSEIIRLSNREVRKVLYPLRRDVRLLKATVSKLRKSATELERFRVAQEKILAKQGIKFEASPEEVKISRFSPRLFRSLRKRLDITQKELGILCGVTLGAVQSWESGKFRPKEEKRKALVALRKLGRGDVQKLLEQRGPGNLRK